MSRYRWTAYSDAIPVAHAPTPEDAERIGRKRLRRPHRVTHLVKRLRAYPFTHLERREVK